MQPEITQELTGMKKNNYPGKFIVIEGLDGSGKTSQADLLEKFLKKNKKEVVRTREQTKDSEAGRKIGRILKKEITATPIELQKLFVQDRKEHLENQIVPALKNGNFVICERYSFSTIAYGYSDDLDVDLLAEMNDNFLLPDLTIIIDVSPDSCIKRIAKRGGNKELFEEKEKLARSREVYKKLSSMFENVRIINGEGDIESVFRIIKKITAKLAR